MDSEYAEVLQEWMPPSAAAETILDDNDDRDFRTARIENRKIFAEKLSRSLRRRSFSESMSQFSFDIDLLSDGIRDLKTLKHFLP